MLDRKEILKLMFDERPWEKEPNRKRFMYRGFRCEVQRHPTMMHLCGYIYIPMVALTEDMIAALDIENRMPLHGGVTLFENTGRKCYRVGFDCAHAGDFVPGDALYLTLLDQVTDFDLPLELVTLRDASVKDYKTVEFVVAELKNAVDWYMRELNRTEKPEEAPAKT